MELICDECGDYDSLHQCDELGCTRILCINHIKQHKDQHDNDLELCEDCEFSLLNQD